MASGKVEKTPKIKKPAKIKVDKPKKKGKGY